MDEENKKALLEVEAAANQVTEHAGQAARCCRAEAEAAHLEISTQACAEFGTVYEASRKSIEQFSFALGLVDEVIQNQKSNRAAGRAGFVDSESSVHLKGK